MNNEFGSTWKEAVVVKFTAISWNFIEGTGENHEALHSS
jgi:hypothetical protein